ncbi:MAG: hypothetical protein Q7S89_00785 [bacterium]|nr:hypothetical protein [bacterium]
MGEKRESSAPPSEQSVDRWSLPEDRLREILSSPEGERKRSYAEMVDRYHDIFGFLKELEAKSLSGGIEVDRMRNRLHKQLLKVGSALGKDAADVQADLLRREGNLAEYKLPEYGILSGEDIFEGSSYDQSAFGGLEIDRKRQGFSRDLSEVDLLDHKRSHREMFEDFYGADFAKQSVSSRWQRIEVPPFGEIPVVETLQPNEVAVLFGIYFTVAIGNDSCPMVPADFPERLRRAVVAARELGGGLFMRTIGAYHDTTTVMGVVVDAARLESDVIGLLRDQKARFGIRKEDMDLQVVEHDRKEEIEDVKSQFSEQGAPFLKEYLDQRKHFFGE